MGGVRYLLYAVTGHGPDLCVAPDALPESVPVPEGSRRREMGDCGFLRGP